MTRNRPSLAVPATVPTPSIVATSRSMRSNLLLGVFVASRMTAPPAVPSAPGRPAAPAAASTQAVQSSLRTDGRFRVDYANGVSETLEAAAGDVFWFEPDAPHTASIGLDARACAAHRARAPALSSSAATPRIRKLEAALQRPEPMPATLFVTTALPYANAPFHVGHIMEYIQADIWVRFQRMQGHRCTSSCADDAHGAPIMIAAEKAGKTPQAFVAEIAAGREQYLDGFHIGFDNWHSTDVAGEPRAGQGHLPRAAQGRPDRTRDRSSSSSTR